MRKILLLVLITILLVSTSLVSAQDGGLDEDEQAILDRLLELTEVVDNYESFVIDYAHYSTSSQDMDLGIFAISSSEVLDVTITATVIRQPEVNISATIEATVERFEDDITSVYTVQAEAIYIADVLYLNILDVASVDGAVAPDFETGWQIADEFHPFYTDLALDDFGSAVLVEEEDDDEQQEIIDVFNEAATSITLEGSEIGGVAVDVITVTVGFEGILAVMGEEFESDDPQQIALMDMMFGMLSEQGDLVNYSIAIDENDNIIGIATEITFNLDGIDLSSLDASLENATMTMLMEIIDVAEFSQINESFDPVEAPE